AVRELDPERTLRAEVELASRNRHHAVVGGVVEDLDVAGCVRARCGQVDLPVLVLVLPRNEAYTLVTRCGVDRDGHRPTRRDRIVDQDWARRNGRSVERGEERRPAANAVGSLVLVRVAEAVGTVRVLLNIAGREDREGKRARRGGGRSWGAWRTPWSTANYSRTPR